VNATATSNCLTISHQQCELSNNDKNQPIKVQWFWSACACQIC